MTPYPTTWRRPPQILTHRGWRYGIQLGVLVYLVLALGTVEVNWARVSVGMDRGLRFVQGFLQPDFTSRWSDISKGLVESLTMTLTSTVVGVAISVPIGIGAARNFAPAWVYYICRSIIAVSRSLQEVIIAIFFVRCSLRSICRVPHAQLRNHRVHRQAAGRGHRGHRGGAGRSDPVHGGSWMQVLNYGIQPQVMPRLIGLSLYRLDINFRESAVIGIVGAGGIGATLNTAMDRYEYDSAGAILLIIIGCVMVAEYGSSYLRKFLQ